MANPMAGISTEILPGAPIRREYAPDPCAVVIFGATGDLTRRKLLPGLYNLAADGFLPHGFSVVGVGRRNQDNAMFRDELRSGVEKHARSQPINNDVWSEFGRRITYVCGDYGNAATFVDLWAQLRESDDNHGTAGNHIFYLAVPASSFPTILNQLHEADLIAPPGEEPWSRVIIEKPFGRDLDSAKQLNRLVGTVLDESQVFRIDHYLGKETVQNILVFRFGNTIFEPMWNRKYVDHVQITASEAIGVEGRGRFYDETGALRDMVQSHLLQVLALCAMEPPVSFAADDIRDAKAQVFRSLRPIAGAEVKSATVRAQYIGFRDEPNVAADSRTPTYAALKVMLDSWRWEGVPFYIRTGKGLKTRVTEVAVHFRPVPLCLFKDDDRCQRLEPNVLTIRVQPDEGISLRFVSKVPGEDISVASVKMDFSYAEAFQRQPQEAYERLLLDAMRGDATLFWRRDAVERAWEFITPILDAWEADGEQPVATYERGSSGPQAADELLRRDRRFWRALS
ncbi:MAG: glucose-6-phosphate dehydrogenase [Myxococcota bacterium]